MRKPIFIQDLWSEVASIYDAYVTRTQNKWLEDFISEEQTLLEEAVLDTLADKADKKVSIMEVGCGTGRNLVQCALSKRVMNRTEYMIGIDSAKGMVAAAFDKKSELDRLGLFSKAAADKIIFLLLDAQCLTNYFYNGRINMSTVASSGDNGKALTKIIAKRFDTSRKIVCNLLNTMGVMKLDTRKTVVREMLQSIGYNDKVLLSVFDADYMPTYAPALYKSIEKIVGDFRAEEAFDFKKFEFFTKKPYYSHWFTEQEIIDLVTSAGGICTRVSKIKAGGHFLFCQKQP